MPNIVELMKKAAVEAVNETKPTGVVFGTVVGVTPLKINVEQKLNLEAAHLLLTDNVRDYTVEMTVEHFTEADDDLKTSHSHPDAGVASFDSTHRHAYRGRKKYTVHNGLKTGEEVILLQLPGGQKYIVLDRLVMR